MASRQEYILSIYEIIKYNHPEQFKKLENIKQINPEVFAKIIKEIEHSMLNKLEQRLLYGNPTIGKEPKGIFEELQRSKV